MRLGNLSFSQSTIFYEVYTTEINQILLCDIFV